MRNSELKRRSENEALVPSTRRETKDPGLTVIMQILERMRAADQIKETISAERLAITAASWKAHLEYNNIPVNEELMGAYSRAVVNSKTGFVSLGNIVHEFRQMEAEEAERRRTPDLSLDPTQCPQCFGKLYVNGQRCPVYHSTEKFYPAGTPLPLPLVKAGTKKSTQPLENNDDNAV